MTVRTASVIFACAALVAVVVVAHGAQRLTAARFQVQSAQSALGQITRDAQELVDLRGQFRGQRVELRQRPQQDVIAQVNAVLAEVGIPSRSLRSLSPESNTQIASPTGGGAWGGGGGGSGTERVKLKRQSLRMVLENLSVQEIGAFLIKWRSAQQVWTTTRIELTHAGGRDANDDRYDATLLISALYVEDMPATESETSPSPSQPRT